MSKDYVRGPSYPAARTVAQKLEALVSGSTPFEDFADAPRLDAAAMEEVITTAFWASLRREEGHTPKISVACLPPEGTAKPVRFDPRLRLEAELLSRLAPAVESPGIHIGAWTHDDALYVWGITRTVPTSCFVIEVVGPGLLVVKYRRSEPSTKFGNIAVLEGADVKFIEQQSTMISEAPPALGSLLAFYTSAGRNDSDNVLVQIAIEMRAHGRGGSLLVVPKNSTRWMNSMVQPLRYSVLPPFLECAVEALAGLTAVDGATVITDHFEPLTFGAKIVTRDSVRRVDQILLTEPIEGVRDIIVDPAQLGGTRHLSAAQFAHDQQNSVALVASQDGRFTVFAWSTRHNMVHAHRLDALLI